MGSYPWGNQGLLENFQKYSITKNHCFEVQLKQLLVTSPESPTIIGNDIVANYWNHLHPGPEKAMATHCSTLTWKIPWMEEPGRLQSIGLHRVGCDWVTSLSLFIFMHWRRKWQAKNTRQCSCLENPRDGGAWWAAIYGIAQSRTRLKRLGSSSMYFFDRS